MIEATPYVFRSYVFHIRPLSVLFFDDHIVIAACQAPPNLKINLSTKPKEIILSWDHPLIMNGPLEKFGIEINEKIMSAYNITEKKYQRTYNYKVSWLGLERRS
jgi:hypothetical protein